MRRAFIFLCLMYSVGAAAGAAPWPLLRGELAGQFFMRGPGDFPPLSWTLTMQPEPRGSEVGLQVTAPGLKLVLTASGPDETSGWRWRITEGAIDLSAWWPRLAQQAGVTELPPDLTLTGVVALAGAGTWHEAQWQGSLQAEIAHGTVGSSTQNWSVPAFRATAQLTRKDDTFLLQALTVQAVEAAVAGVTLRHLTLDAIGDEQRRLLVRTASIDMLGGRIALKPFAVDPLNPVIDTTAEVAGVALAQLAALMPAALREASGQVGGRVEVRWSASLGPKTGAGSLQVTPASPANFRLAATPGFLTQHTPERIYLVPETWGWLARWLSFENPAYDTLRRIELGEMPLQVENLSIELYPDGLGGPRSAAVRVTARPASGSVVEQVTFAINIAGPLDQVLRLGTSDRVKLNFGAKP